MAVVPAGAHTTLPPQTSRTDMPRITTGEIHDLEYIGNRVFVSGTFTSIRNNRGTNTTSYNQRYLAAFSLDTGLVDTNFRPTFDGSVEEIEASPCVTLGDGDDQPEVGADEGHLGLVALGDPDVDPHGALAVPVGVRGRL